MFFSKNNISPIFMSILSIVMLVGCGSGDKPSAITTDPTIIALDKLGGAYIRGTPPPKTKLNFSPYSNHAITLKNFLSPRAMGKNSSSCMV